jgi:hypothetical protein
VNLGQPPGSLGSPGSKFPRSFFFPLRNKSLESSNSAGSPLPAGSGAVERTNVTWCLPGRVTLCLRLLAGWLLAKRNPLTALWTCGEPLDGSPMGSSPSFVGSSECVRSSGV